MLIMKIPFIKRSKRSGLGFVVAIDCKGVQFARVRYVAGRPQVVTYSFHPVTGTKSSGITPAVLEKIRKEMKVGDFQFSTLLSPGEYQLMQVEAPNVPQEEMKAAVRWSIKDLLSYHVDEATIDIVNIPGGQSGVERKKSLYVVVASNEVIKKRTQLFVGAHINLSVIDIPEMAQRNIAKLYEDEGRALALLAFDENSGLLTFTSNGELYLARRIEISAGQLQDADVLLRQQYFDRLELEMQRSMDHFDRQFNHLTVKRLLVAGPDNVGLVESLANSLSVPVEILDLSEVMDLDEAAELANAEAQVYALHALGAALRQEEKPL